MHIITCIRRIASYAKHFSNYISLLVRNYIALFSSTSPTPTKLYNYDSCMSSIGCSFLTIVSGVVLIYAFLKLLPSRRKIYKTVNSRLALYIK